MAQRTQHLKAELVDKVARLAHERLDPDKAPMAERFMRQYYANVAPEDMVHREVESLYGAAMGLRALARERRPGTPRIRVYNPSVEQHGWHSDHTVVEVVNDDMPFLVDSTTNALQRMDLGVHLVVHPIMGVERDDKGRLREVTEKGREAALVESMMHIEVDRQTDDDALRRLHERLATVLTDVREAVEDWQPMRERIEDILAGLHAPQPAVTAEEVHETLDFLRWLHEDHFTFLGYRRALFRDDGIDIDAESGLGILRDADARVFDSWRDLGAMPKHVLDHLRRPTLLQITKSDREASVHRAVPMDVIGVKWLDDAGRVAGLHVFVGLFASSAYTRNPTMIPVLRRKVATVIRRAGFRPSSHDGKALLNILENYPRDELFQIEEDDLFATAQAILRLQERPRVALFVRRDEFGRFVSALVFVPRDRYDTALRLAVTAILEETFGGTVSAWFTQVGESPLARLQFIVKLSRDAASGDVDVDEVEARLAEAARSWSDRLQDALVTQHGEERGLRLYRRYARAFPASYREAHSAQVAVYDIARLDGVLAGAGLALNLYRPVEAAEDEARLKVYNRGRPVPLSDVLPMLENMGFRVIGEVPHHIRAEGREGLGAWLHDFALVSAAGGDIDITRLRERIQECFLRVWHGDAEDDGFNRLVLLAGLEWREVAALRAYAKYLRQAAVTFSQAYMEDALADNPAVVRHLVDLFHARFEPGRDDRAAREAALAERLAEALDAVASADQDRILRRFLNLVLCTLRTNYYQRDAEGRPKPYLALKLDSRQVEELPLPRPWAETFVYSPRVEAVHLRGGKVARGGVRWSDRREDFRTEILGLMKAQTVKNAVIIPVGAKGGFVVKRPPAAREDLGREGVECYRIMVRGLLDITDNRVGGAVVPPPDVVRRDDDDPYVVVAADKGTATFSDIANALAAEYGFWLGDAFASGGSHGYDHKAMGITARGAWESVKRHFRELGVDTQTTDFTVVGVGDMSGDVFGNGMLLSEHIRLVGAFNHLHIFCDPDPDPAAGFAERQRLFALPRSQWSDYDAKALSKGGAVYRRDAKTITLTPEIKDRFGLGESVVTPSALIRAMLAAEVDLLWFGGIGTYVKASRESHAAVGDRANDAVRVDAAALRCKVVGEGANLAVTQLGRIEYALADGRINTDAIDNSGGVDTSDHEVNIKILLNETVAEGDLTVKQRNELLTAMTDEVARHVLRDNYLQGQAISLIECMASDMLDQHERLMRLLEKSAGLNRAVEYLPDDEALAERAAARRGLTRPEIAVVLAYSKIWLFDRLLESELPDDPMLVEELERYFPAPLAARYPARLAGHRLRREIIATRATNSMINRTGGAFVSEIAERSGAAPVEIARAYVVVRDSFGLRELWDAIEALDNRVPAQVQTDMLVEANRLIARGTMWLLHHGAKPLDLAAARAQLQPQVESLRAVLDDILPPDTAEVVAARADAYRRQGVPDELAREAAHTIVLASANDIGRIAHRSALPVEKAGELYFAVGARFGLGWLRSAADTIPAAPGGSGHWQKLAVAAVIDDLYALQRDLSQQIAAAADEGAAVDGLIAAWTDSHANTVERADQLIAELRAAGSVDLAVITVANRQLRSLAEL